MRWLRIFLYHSYPLRSSPSQTGRREMFLGSQSLPGSSPLEDAFPFSYSWSRRFAACMWAGEHEATRNARTHERNNARKQAVSTDMHARRSGSGVGAGVGASVGAVEGSGVGSVMAVSD